MVPNPFRNLIITLFAFATLVLLAPAMLMAQSAADGTPVPVTAQFGGCQKDTPNCLVTPAGWNYSVRQYPPHAQMLNGNWEFPETQPVK
jgi:hypothetical protein